MPGWSAEFVQLAVRRLPPDEATSAPFELIIGAATGNGSWNSEQFDRYAVLPEALYRLAEAAVTVLTEHEEATALLRDHSDPTIDLLDRLLAGLRNLDRYRPREA